MKYSKV